MWLDKCGGYYTFWFNKTLEAANNSLVKKVYKFLYSSFYYCVFNYEFSEAKEKVIEKLYILFNEKKGLFKSPNLSGSFVEYDTFYMVPKYSFMVIKGGNSDPAILKGVVSDTINNKTTIEIAVKPNIVFLLLFLVFLCVGVFGIYKSFTAGGTEQIAISLSIFCIALPLITIIARSTSMSLRNNFETYFEITPVNTDKPF